MERRIFKPCRQMAVALCVFLTACGGGDDDGSAPVPTGAANNQDTFLAAGAQGKIPSPTPGLPATIHGLKVEIYANVNEPMKLSFGPDGALYVGRHGGVRIHRIASGGSSASEFGPSMVDPDAVLFDAAGLISSVPDSVLVGGGGVLAAIFPDQTTAVIFNSGFADMDDMKFDHAGRLVFSDDASQVLISNGDSPTVLLSTPSRPGSIAIDENNRIFVTLADGTIRVYHADGTLIDSAFATGLAGLDTYLAFGPGAGGFGRALYVLNGGNLLRFDKRGRSTLVGTGFGVGPSSGTGFVFGPDKALYISEYHENRILRISRRAR